MLRHAGWAGILTVVAFHLVQILFSALSWWVIAGPTKPRPGLRTYLVMRWIREAVNNLLPVAQIGGEFVVARPLQRIGMNLASAISGTVADLTTEMVTQILFTLLGLLLLLHSIASGTGLHNALIGCYRSRSRVAWAGLWQMVSWVLGGVEVCLALHFLGNDVGIVPQLIIESLGQALKAAGFIVLGALGVQEGGYIVIC